MRKQHHIYWSFGTFFVAVLLIHTTFASAKAYGSTTLFTNTKALTTAVPGDPLPRITCIDGYTATIYAENLSGPHGLAFHPNGTLYVSEDAGGRVSQISSSGVVTAVLTGLSFPEGITFDSDGNLYVVEDIENGRLIKQTPTMSITLANNLQAPEGVTVAADGTIYVTGSELQLTPLDASPAEIENIEAYVISYAPTVPYTPTTVISVTPDINIQIISLTEANVFIEFDSLTGIAQGNDGLLYLTNELSGLDIMTTTQVSGPFGPITADVFFSSTKSIYTVDPFNPPAMLSTPFAENLVTPEGLNFPAGGLFPLYVAEEDSSGVAQSGTGRLSRVASDGSQTTLCTGFSTIEDVIVDNDGNIFVAEDGTGLIIKLTSASCIPPTAVSNITPTLNNTLFNLTWSGGGDYTLIHQDNAPYFTLPAISCTNDVNCGLSETTSYSQTVTTENSFWQLTAVNNCGATTAPTQTQGLFSFGLDVGS